MFSTYLTTLKIVYVVAKIENDNWGTFFKNISYYLCGELGGKGKNLIHLPSINMEQNQ